MIYRLRSYGCPSFICFFHLWGLGGPNWHWEFSVWSVEQESEWQIVNRRKSLLTGANATLITPDRSFVAVVHGSRPDPISSDQAPLSRRHSISNSALGPITSPAHLPSPPSPAHFTTSPFRLQSDIFCQRCLSPGHLSSACTNKICCRGFYNYGHVVKSCFSRKPKTLIYRIKRKSPEFLTSQPPDNRIVVPSSLAASPSLPSPTSPGSTPTDDAPPHLAMANYPYDSYPHLPPGTDIVQPSIHRCRRGFHVVSGAQLLNTDQWAIVVLEPPTVPRRRCPHQEFPQQ
jgi:hypothetical protein